MDKKQLKDLASHKKDENKQPLPLGINVNDVLKKNKQAHDNKRKIKRNERIKLEILKNTRYYTKGQHIAPAIALAEHLIEKKIAKKTNNKQ